MPTAVTTTTMAASSSSISLKAGSSSGAAAGASDAALATLRSLYPRAAKAFLERNVSLTHSLLSSAFAMILPPATGAADAISSHRRKWDILRITFETTLYASPPRAHDPESLPSPLRANLLLSPESFLATVHTRSLQLFTPALLSQKPTAAYLPAQILVTLVLSCLKLECTHVGRGMIEDWLARRSDEGEDGEGYAKALELYCLHVLPRLEEWDYAEEFLQYERLLPAETRKYMLTSLRTLRSQSAAARAPASLSMPVPPPSTSPSTMPSRSPSPALSTTSSGTASSTSTHTATPLTPRPGKGKLTALTPAPANNGSSSSIASAATSRTVTPDSARWPRSKTRGVPSKLDGPSDPSSHEPNGHAPASSSRPSTAQRSSWRAPRTSESSASASSSRSHSLVPAATSSGGALALLRHYAEAVLAPAARSKLTAFLVFCVALPVLSFLLRRGRAQPASKGAADAVRRRLRAAEGEGFVGAVWHEVLRSVGDTVRMGGRGLV